MNSILTIPKTEGIKYTGSKLKILPYIINIISDLEIHNILDGFSGSTRVSQALAKLNFKVTACDVSDWSEIFGRCYLLNKNKPEYYKEIINHLNNIPDKDGWFTEFYGGEIDSKEKRPFQKKNTRKLDAIREEIDNLDLSDIEKAVALSSLILALDSVDNTMGHYVSYLSNWSLRSYNDLILKIPKVFQNLEDHNVIKSDVLDILKNEKFDLAYFDPPYGSNNKKMPSSRVRYNSYYHIWSTIIKNDKPELFGKANRRIDSRDSVKSSVFEEYRKDLDNNLIAVKAIKDIIHYANSKYVLFSYGSNGITPKEELYSILKEEGEILKALEIDYKRNVMGNMCWTNEWKIKEESYKEYLFLIKK